MWTLHLAIEIETRYYAHEDILSFAKLQPAQYIQFFSLQQLDVVVSAGEKFVSVHP